MRLSERAKFLLAGSDRHWIFVEIQGLEEKLAKYENDETARRRVDAYEIRQLKQIIKHSIGATRDILRSG